MKYILFIKKKGVESVHQRYLTHFETKIYMKQNFWNFVYLPLSETKKDGNHVIKFDS